MTGRCHLLAVLLLVPPTTLASDPWAGTVESPSSEAVNACLPHAASAPGRLNLDVTAVDYGVIPPCEAVVDFYIPRNTSLRAVTGTLQYLSAEGVLVQESAFDIGLEENGGMFQQRLVGAPVAGLMCGTLQLGLEVSNCLDGSGKEITCPPVRVKGSYVFEKMAVHGDGVKFCAD